MNTRPLSQLNAEALFFGNKVNLVLSSQPAQGKIQKLTFAIQLFLKLRDSERASRGQRLPNLARRYPHLLLDFYNFSHLFVPPRFQNLWLLDDSINPAMQDLRWNRNFLVRALTYASLKSKGLKVLLASQDELIGAINEENR